MTPEERTLSQQASAARATLRSASYVAVTSDRIGREANTSKPIRSMF